MDRRQFVKGAASAVVLGPALLHLGGCGDDDAAGGDGGAANAGTQGSTSGAGAGSGAGTSAAGTNGAGTGGSNKDGSVSVDGSAGEDSGQTPVDGGHGNMDAAVADGGADAAPDAPLAVCESGASATAITDNHGHSLTISKEDVQAGVQKSYSIEGAAGHPHNVVVTAAHFVTLAAGGSVMITSDGGHTHEVTIECA